MRNSWSLGLLAVAILAIACSSSDVGTKCVDDKDCPQAFICLAGSCGQQECTSHSECPGTSPFCAPAGVDPENPTVQYCSPLMCKTPADCPTAGQLCNEFRQCVSGSQPEDDSVVEEDGTQPEEDITDPTDTVTPAFDNVCKACSTNADCNGAKCQPLGGGTFCFTDCASNDDCPTGWMCYALSAEGKQCIPNKFNCEATCLVEGCPEGQTCNQDNGQCVSPKAQCGSCQSDWECGEGLRCAQTGKFCAPSCGNGAACPENSVCQEVNPVKVNLCIPQTAECCFGTDCGDPCPAETPYSKNGVCVECLNNTHCTAGTCDATGSCVTGSCTDPNKPYEKNGQCYQCLEDAHCSAIPDTTCQGNVCKPGTQPEECSYCQAPYPACVQINGIWSCVQCTTDAECPGSTCDTSLYACKNNGGGPGGTCGICTTNTDCVSTTGTFPSMACDTASKCCYDTNGYCDGVEAMCKGGLACKSLMDLFMGGGGGGIPSLPGMPTGGMGGMTGMCECTQPVSDMMALFPCLMGACPASGECVKGVCLDPSLLTSLLGGGTGTPSATGLCLDPSSLLGGIF